MDRQTADVLGRGFADQVMDAQRCFRAVLAAMAEPGTVQTLCADVAPPPRLTPAAAIMLLTLADHDTPVWLQPHLADGAAAYVRFHTGAPLAVDPARACFAIVDAPALPELASFDQGDERFPDRSATVIVQCTALTGGATMDLAGPGIRERRRVAPRGLSGGFWSAVAANTSRYPLGVDLVLAADSEIMCLPRSTRVVDALDADRGKER